VIVADACTELLLPADTVAVFEYAAQLEEDVVLVTCTIAVAFDAKFPKLQLSSWLVIEHVPGPLYVGLMLQVIPVPDGRGSFRAAVAAVPAPVLVAVSVYPMGEPADTVAASAMSVRFKPGHCTVVVADACWEVLFVDESEALFG
jgi:hypothetical protein